MFNVVIVAVSRLLSGELMKYSGDCGPIPHTVRDIANNDRHVNDTDNWPIMAEWECGQPRNQKFKPHSTPHPSPPPEISPEPLRNVLRNSGSFLRPLPPMELRKLLAMIFTFKLNFSILFLW